MDTTRGNYQRIVEAYRNPDRAAAKQQLTAVIKDLAGDVPPSLAHFDRLGTSNGPTEAINGRLEHLRGTALGFRNLAHYILRSLPDTGDFKPLLHLQLRQSTKGTHCTARGGREALFGRETIKNLLVSLLFVGIDGVDEADVLVVLEMTVQLRSIYLRLLRVES